MNYGSSERENRTIVETARTLLQEKGLPVKLLAKALNAAVVILNQTGSSSVKGESPLSLWSPLVMRYTPTFQKRNAESGIQRQIWNTSSDKMITQKAIGSSFRTKNK